MKKIFIISLAVMMLMSFTACSKKEETKVPDDTTTLAEELPEYTQDTEEIPDETIPEETEAPKETTTAAPEETTVPEETTAAPADTTAEITTAATTAAETTTAATTQAASAVSTVKGKGYSFKIDSAKWMDISAYIDTISKEAEKLGQNKINISAEQIKAANDFIYFNTKNRNVVCNAASTEVGDTSKLDLSNASVKSMFSQILKEQYEKVGFTYVGDKVTTVAGRQCLVMTIEAPAGVTGATTDMRAQAYVFFVGNYQYVFTYTASKSDFNTYKADFEEILSTLTF